MYHVTTPAKNALEDLLIAHHVWTNFKLTTTCYKITNAYHNATLIFTTQVPITLVSASNATLTA